MNVAGPYPFQTVQPKKSYELATRYIRHKYRHSHVWACGANGPPDPMEKNRPCIFCLKLNLDHTKIKLRPPPQDVAPLNQK